MTKKLRIESVGWGFFGAMILLLLAPSIYFVLQQTNESITIGMRVGAGIMFAFFAAALLSWAVNSVLQLLASRGEASGAGDQIQDGPPDSAPASSAPRKPKKKKKRK